MYIKKMTAWFGALDGKSLELNRGLNVLYAPNESGKSTWCAFIRAMLYGVDTAQRSRQGQLPDKQKYRPWNGTPMSGSMDILTDAGAVTLRRWTERAGQPMQAFSATVTGTDEPAAGLTAEDAGRALTGAPREVFERSAFIHQAGLGFTSDPELEKRFAAIVSAGDEEQSASQAEARLRAWQRRRRSGRRGAIPELEGEMERIRQELEQMEDSGRAVEQLERELDQAAARQGELVRQMEQARSQARKKALEDYRTAKTATEERAQALSAAEEEKAAAVQALQDSVFQGVSPEDARAQAAADREQAQRLTGQVDALPPMWLAAIPLAIGLILMILGLVLPWKAVFLVAGAAFYAAAAGTYFWLRGVGQKADGLLEQRMEILDRYGVQEPEQIDELLAEYEQLCTAARAAVKKQRAAAAALESARQQQKQLEEPVLNGLDFVNGDSEAARASRAAAEGQARIDRLREQRAMAEGHVRAMGDAMVLRSEQQALAERRRELLTQEQALQLALDTLGQADSTLREKFSPVLAQRAAALFGELTAGRYDEITLARDLTARARLSGEAVGWETDYLSQGARDQLYLALRLAVCELVLPLEQACPIILDDALAAFDRERMGRALELLKRTAAQRQILLFSCHRRESEYFAGDESVRKIELGA